MIFKNFYQFLLFVQRVVIFLSQLLLKNFVHFILIYDVIVIRRRVLHIYFENFTNCEIIKIKYLTIN
jgi:hypothetical protein